MNATIAWAAGLALASAGCWSTRIDAPGVAPRPGSIGYGVQTDTVVVLWASGSQTGVGIAAHAPPKGEAAALDSFWRVHHQKQMQFCLRRPGGETCLDAEYVGEKPVEVLHIVDPLNLGRVRAQVADYRPSGPLIRPEVEIAARAAAFLPDRAVWLTNVFRLYRCSLEGTRPVCREARFD